MGEFENRPTVPQSNPGENNQEFVLSGQEITTTFGERLKAVFNTLLSYDPGQNDRGVFASWWLPQIEARESEEKYRTTGERELHPSFKQRLILAWKTGITMDNEPF